MDYFSATSKSVVGLPTEKTWAQSFSFGELFGVISLSGEDAVSISACGKNILEAFEQEYLNLSSKNLDSLKAMIARMTEKAEGFELCLVIAVCVGKALYLINKGAGQALLCRGRRQGLILGSGDTSASGLLEPGDTLLLFTKEFFSLVSLEQVQRSLDSQPPEAICDGLATLISQNPNNGLTACLVVRFEKKTKEETYFDSLPSIKKGGWFLAGLQSKVFALSPFVTRLANSLFSKFLLYQKLSFKRGFFIRRAEDKTEKPRQVLLTVGLILIFLLFSSAILGVQKLRREERLAAFTNFYSLSELKYTDGKALLELNPVRARTLLADSKKTAEEAKAVAKGEKTATIKIEGLLKNINEALEGISGIYRLDNIPTFFDLTVIKEKGTGSKLSLNNKKLAILDSTNNSVYLMGVDGKNAEIVGGGALNFANSKFISLHGDYAYVFSDSGIMEIDVVGKKSKLAVEKNPAWGTIGAMIEYGAFGGNLYLLDIANSKILKFSATDSGFSSAKDYLAAEVKPSFSQVASMAIDGSIYLLFSDGKISRFTQGKPDFFNLTGLDSAFSSPTALYTDEDSNNLYVLDGLNKRIVVIDKDKKPGFYVSQYVWEELGKASDFAVDEAEKKIFVLLGSKIFSIDLR